MPDWERIVGENLRLKPNRPHEAELTAELASHLEEVYRELCRAGAAEKEAFQQCLEQLHAARSALSAIRNSKEGTMNYRSKALWLPGLVTLTLASVSLMVMQVFAFSRPRVYWVDGVNV